MVLFSSQFRKDIQILPINIGWFSHELHIWVWLKMRDTHKWPEGTWVYHTNPCGNTQIIQVVDDKSRYWIPWWLGDAPFKETSIYWLVVWNMNFIFPYIGNVIIPTDFHIFQRGGSTTKGVYIYTVWWLYVGEILGEIYQLGNNHRPWKSPIFHGFTSLHRPRQLPGSNC